MSADRDSTRRTVACLALLMGLYVLLAGALTAGRYGLAGDSFAYLGLARNLASGEGYTHLGDPEVYRQPGYPFLVCVAHALVQDLELAGHLVALLAGMLAVPATYWAGRGLLSRDEALLAAALVACNGFFVHAGAEALSETANALASILAIGCLLRTLGGTPGAGALYGAACGFAYLCRSESLLLVSGVACIAAAARLPVRTRVRELFAALVLLVLVCLPYWSFLHRAFGHISLGGNAVNLIWYQSDPEVRPPASLRPEWAPDPFDPRWPTRTDPADFEALSYVLLNLPELLARYLRNGLTFLGPLAEVTFYALGWPLWFLGLRSLWRRGHRSAVFALLLGFLPALALPFRPGTDRLLKPFIPLASLFMAVGLLELLSAARPWPSSLLLRSRRAALALGVLALLPLCKFARHLGAPEARGRFRAVGEAIRAREGERDDLVVMAQTIMPGFHARAETVALPDTRELAQVLAQMDRYGASYLVVDRAQSELQVAEFANPGALAGLEWIATFPGELDVYRRSH